MLKRIALAASILHILINYCHATLPEDTANTAADCFTNSLETSLLCSGSRAINNIINNLIETDKPIVVVPGLEIVPSQRSDNNSANNNRNLNEETAALGAGDNTFLERFAHYLRTHELSIKFSDLIALNKSDRFGARDSEQNGIQMNLAEEARKKDKGNSLIMVLGLMLSKVMTVMSLGGVGALAMKALGVAVTALMMATMMGVKSLAQHGNESSHNVQYVTADGHHQHKSRRRRTTRDNKDFSKTPSILSQEKMPETKMELPSLVFKGWQPK